jgi:RNA polymerase sigma-70 factor, ECF subfamily
VPDIEDDRDQRECRFCSLYEEHYRSIQAYAVRRVESADDVADVVAEVFTIAWRRLTRIPEPPADRLWLYGVARRVVAGKIRSARRFRQLTARLQASHPADRNPGAHDLESAQGLDQVLVHGAMADGAMADGTVADGTGADGTERDGTVRDGTVRDGTVRDRLAVAIARLRPAEREALTLVLWDELSHAEAADVLGCSVNAVAIRVHRAKARLRDALTSTDQAGRAAGPLPAAAETNRS